MAKSRSIDLNVLQRRAHRLCGQLGWNPEGLTPAQQRRLFKEIASDPRVDPSPAFMRAKSAVDALAAAEELHNTAVKLYWDPKVRAIAGSQEVLDYYWRNPDQAMSVLAQHSLDFPQSAAVVREVMMAIGEVESFHETHGSSGSESSAVEQTNGRPPVSEVGSRAPVAARSASREGRDRPRPQAKFPDPKSPPAKGAAAVNAEWARAVAEHERSHPPEDDAGADIPGYYGDRYETDIEESKNADDN